MTQNVSAPDQMVPLKSAGILCRAAETVCDCRAKTLEKCKRPVEGARSINQVSLIIKSYAQAFPVPLHVSVTSKLKFGELKFLPDCCGF